MRRLALLALVLIAAGCGGQHTTSTSSENGGAAAGRWCNITLAGTREYVSVLVSGRPDPEPYCRAIARHWSSAQAFWSLYGKSSSDTSLVCQLAPPPPADPYDLLGAGPMVVTVAVYDAPEGRNGARTCGKLIADGWTEYRIP
ncbi:MAG TPA: hypothetical protein VGJ25_09000 [Gaiellaceae bacterium]